MIEILQLSKSFGEKRALENLSLQVHPGEILGFLGPNGAGKTTTVKLLAGMLRPTSGTARVLGFDVLEQPLEVKKRIGYVPESGALFESLTAWEYLQLVADLHHLDIRRARNRMEEFLTLFGLYDDKDQRLNAFSRGMKQKVLISAALLHNPAVLLLDEPLIGLDASAALVVKELLRKFSAQGKTILFCSHVLEVVERICSRIAIINQGKFVMDGTPEDITRRTGEATLEEAFVRLTGVRDVRESAREFLQILDRI